MDIGGLAECCIDINEGRGRERSDEGIASSLPCTSHKGIEIVFTNLRRRDKKVKKVKNELFSLFSEREGEAREADAEKEASVAEGSSRSKLKE